MNRCRAAHDLLNKTIQQDRIDVVIGCEPNKKCDNSIFCDTKCDTFLYIDNKYSVLNSSRGEGFVMIELQDLIFVSCYFSPNDQIENFNKLLGNLETTIKMQTKEVVIGGDLNAKTPLIGSGTSNERGRYLEDWLIANDLTVINEGNTPTFCGPNGTSIIDFTATTSGLSKDVKSWRVHPDIENFSDHNAIKFMIELEIEQPRTNTGFTKRWDVGIEKMKTFESTIAARLESIEHVTPEEVVGRITQSCNEVFSKKGNKHHKHAPAYWWNNEIAEKRKWCHKMRRKYTRSRALNEQSQTKGEDLREQYKDAKRQLKNAIINSKRTKWRELCDDLDNDIWGKAYQIVTKRWGTTGDNRPSLKETLEQVDILFPKNATIKWPSRQVRSESIPTLEQDELFQCLQEMKPRKAPGPDGITTVILKACIKAAPEIFVQLYGRCIECGNFPSIWKSASLVLLAKPKKTVDSPNTYRPICLIDTAGKLLEIIIKNRLQKEIVENDMIQQNQYGFVKGRTTIDALEKVKEISSIIKQKAHKNREFAVMILLDVKNAFNSAPWEGIITQLIKGNVSEYLLQLIESYFSQRYIILPNGEKRQITCGVPQGSVLGPTLWNVFYDQAVKLKMETGVQLIAYADDLAVVVTGRTLEQLEDKAQYAVENVIHKLQRMGVTTATEKTEMVLLAGRRKIPQMSIKIENNEVISSQCVKYLGVYLDKDLKMTTHVKKVAERGLSMYNNLRRIMPRIGGPGSAKRQILVSAVRSVLLYAAPIWSEALRYDHYKKTLTRVNRGLAIGVTAAYRTVATEAVQVLAKIPPIDLAVAEREAVYRNGKEQRDTAREELLRVWQTRWENYNGWSKTFIKNVKEWTTKEYTVVNHYLTQAITGHGVFGVYLEKIGKKQNADCWFCGERDTPEHTVFLCGKFNDLRRITNIECGVTLTKENISSVMMESEHNWQLVTSMLETVMKSKVKEEKRLEGMR